MRQTDLTAEQIIHRLEDDDPEYPTCFYINELGELAQAGDTTAEGVLSNYLEPAVPPMERAPAYLHLKMCRHPLAQSTQRLLRDFEVSPLNCDILAWARRTMEQLNPSATAH